MRKRKLLGALLMIAALILTTLPVTEAVAASSASDFVIEGNTLVKYKGTETSVSIPNTVTTIGKSAFEDNATVEYVVLPNSVKKIEAYAFWGCDKLRTVSIGKGIKEIGDYAFAGCKGMKSMNIPSTVTSIGMQAFGDCVNMTDIVIPPEVNKIHESAFDGCGRLKISCEEGSVAAEFAEKFYEKQKEMQEYEDVPGYSQEETETEDKPEEEDQPSETSEPVEVFNGKLIGSTHVVGNQAIIFIDTAGVSVVNGEGTSNSSVLETPETEKPETEGTDSNDTADTEEKTESGPVKNQKFTIVDGKVVADQAYYKGKLDDGFALPSGIEEIGEFSFARSNLKEITIPKGVKSIDYGAFYHCDDLTKVKLPESVMIVEPKAFENTAWVNQFKQGNQEFLISGGVLVAYNGKAENVIIPDDVRVIAAEAFANHNEIKTVTIPDSVQIIGEACFVGCNSLDKVELNQGLLWIKDRAFYQCENLNEISVPESVKYVGLLCFGDAKVTYNGKAPEIVYETSATRLANCEYRNVVPKEVATVKVKGTALYRAKLSGAQGEYSLDVSLQQQNIDFVKAWKRVTDERYPENINYYHLNLTDDSGIPIKKLGLCPIKMLFKIPEEYAGKEVKALALDRNGQLVLLDVEPVVCDKKTVLLLAMNYISDIALYSEEASNQDIVFEEISWEQLSAAPGQNDNNVNLTYVNIVKFVSAILLFATGLLVFLSGKRKKIA